MRKDSFRKISSFFLILAVWLSTGSMLPVFAQTDSNTTKGDTAKKDSKSKDPKKADTQTQTKSPNGLSPNEDPSMIGKRNINGGTGDKFFCWLGGSKEKEAQVGRQLAMEVEQQVKLIDDLSSRNT